MPVRATKRGPERTPLGGAFDVVVCGASFAGLTVARELRGTGARVLVLDRYEIGERQTSACAAPTEWLANLGLEASIRQTFGSLLVHTPRASARWPLDWTFSTFDYPALCAALWAQRGGGTEFETAKVDGRTLRGDGQVIVHTDRGDVSAPLVVDALGWKRNLGAALVQPPNARLSRGLEVHPGGTGGDLELWIDKRLIPAGYGWSFPAGDEVRVGVGSFDPHDGVKQPTVRLADDLGLPPDGYQGNWIPHRLRARRRGRDLLRRRLRRPLPPGHRGGHPHGVLLRDRLRARAAGRARGPARRAPRRSRATPRSPMRTAGSTSACWRCSTRYRSCGRGC